MKKILLAVLAALLFIYSANAQIKKGSVFLGGDVGASAQKTKSGDVTTNKQNGINISPVFGKAIKENLVLGMSAGFGIYNNKYPAGSYSNLETDFYNAGVFLRKYKNIGASGFYLFVQGGINGGYMKQKQEGPFAPDLNELKRISVSINAYPGLSYGISRKLHLETGFNNLLSLGYFHDKAESRTTGHFSKTNGFNISSSLNNASSSLYLGFRLLIGK